jgi:hypothetical protein
MENVPKNEQEDAHVNGFKKALRNLKRNRVFVPEIQTALHQHEDGSNEIDMPSTQDKKE